MTDQARTDHSPRPDTSPEEAAKALASVYGFLLKRHAEKYPEPEGGGGQSQKVVGKRTER